MKMVLAGGGTGGHLFPAVALAQRLLESNGSSRVLFIGTSAGIEAKILPELGLPLETIHISGIAGRNWLGRISILPALIKSVRESISILKSFEPDVVVGVGGYASGPALLAAKMLQIPFLIHEQNADFGMTNRFLARFADRICLSFPPRDRETFHPEKTVVTGNPVRNGISGIGELQDGPPTLLIFGGSRGAQAINDAIVASLPELMRQNPGLKIVHQTGSGDYARMAAAYDELRVDSSFVTPFIQDMAAAYKEAQLILCRAGATTLAELTAAGRPAILVPYPYAAADHQTANAKVLAEKGAALLLPQQELSGNTLPRIITELLNDRPTLLRMAALARSFEQPQATDRLLAECHRIARKG